MNIAKVHQYNLENARYNKTDKKVNKDSRCYKSEKDKSLVGMFIDKNAKFAIYNKKG